MRKIFILLLLGAIMLVGCSVESSDPVLVDSEETNGESTTDDNGENSSEEKKEETELEEEKVFNVGESVELDGAIITITNVEKSPGNEWDNPKEGQEYVIVHLKIENNGDENISYNSFDYSLKNSNGQITDQAFTTIDNDTSLSSGDLASGGFVEGTVTFEAPKDDNGLQLIYTPNWLLEDKNIVFNLQ